MQENRSNSLHIFLGLHFTLSGSSQADIFPVTSQGVN